MRDSFEFMYADGVIETYILEGDYVSIEFFPSSQSNDSFESAEYNSIFRITTLLEGYDTLYEWNVPSGVAEQDLYDFRMSLEEFLSEYVSAYGLSEV